jgi:hypothetical protein
MSPRTLRPRAGGFNPASISNLGAWWDFSDSSTVSLSLSAITSVTDKSGNSRTATQSTGNNQPAIAASVRNGRSAALFDGLNDALDVTWGVQQFTAITLFAVVQTAQALSSIGQTPAMRFLGACHGRVQPAMARNGRPMVLQA